MESKIINDRKNFFCITLLCCFGVSFLPAYADLPGGQQTRHKERLIRIAVFQDLKEADLSVNGNFLIAAVKDPQKILDEGKALKKISITSSAEGIAIGKRKFSEPAISLVPEYDDIISIQNRRFRGTINIIRTADPEKFMVVNVIGLEEYIKGVLFHEVSHRWPIEALKAQAVAARTYALYRLQTTGDKDFDVTNDIYSQVYGGRNSERYRTNLAVDRTRDEILLYNGKILPAYFHATCAGRTEDAGELWKENLPPLKGVACAFCRNSPHYSWKRNFRSKDVQDKLNANGFHLELIKDIRVLERNPSGRIRTLQITARDEQKTVVSGKDFRNIVGPNVIRSNDYDIVMKGYYFDMLGKGWGHGVGLCQWGAFGMARERHDYREILEYYYPGAESADLKD